MKLIGHKTEEMYKRYRIVGESDLNDAVEKLDDYFRGQKAVVDQKVLFFREAKKMLDFHSYTLHDAYTMTPRQFKRLRLALGMKQEELAEELEVSRVSVTRYENGTIVVPRPIVKLLKYIAEEKGRAA